MTQSGPDTILHLSSSETLTFRNITPSQFTDGQFLAPLDTTKLGAMTFDDEFNSLQIRDPSTGAGVWNTNFGGNLKDQWAYSLPSNGEQEAYVQPGFQGRGEQDIGVDPFSVSNGILTITAAPTTADSNYPTWGANFTSGMLNTENSFAQKYGYFEMRAEVPTAAGAWPAFWMLPSPYKPNAEADIMEGLGATPNVDYRRAFGGAGGDETQYDNALNSNPGGFHTYGMLWTPQTVTFYFDGIEVLQGATPSTWTSPMAMIVNLAVGGWGGTPDASQFPAQMQVDYIRAYALADGSSQVTQGTPDPPVATLVDQGAATTPAAAPVAFEAGGGPVTSAHIQLSSAPPTSLPAGETMMVWEHSGAVFGAVSDGVTLATPTALMAGTISQFTGAGTWLTGGKVVVAYEQANSAGGQDLWDMVFDPAKLTFVRQDLGAADAQSHATFVATPYRRLRGQLAFRRRGDGPRLRRIRLWRRCAGLVRTDPRRHRRPHRRHQRRPGACGQRLRPGGLQPLRRLDLHALRRLDPDRPGDPRRGRSGATTAFTFAVTRTGDISAAGTVSWAVSGSGAHPADAADFQGDALPSGVANFAAGASTSSITVNVAGDATAENDEGFTVTLSSPSRRRRGVAERLGQRRHPERRRRAALRRRNRWHGRNRWNRRHRQRRPGSDGGRNRSDPGGRGRRRHDQRQPGQ